MTHDPIADLESQLVRAAERHFAVRTPAASASTRRRWRLPTSLLAVAAAAVISVPALAATGVIDLHRGGPVTPRTEVATGSTPETGRWKIVHSRDAAGAACIGLELLDERQPGESAVLYEGCGGPSDLNVASLSGATRTVIYGRAPTEAAAIELTAHGGLTRRITPTASEAGARGKFFLVVLPPGERDVAVTAADAAGDPIASEMIPITDDPR